MTLSLDTNVMVDLVNGRPHVRERYDEAIARGEPLVTCVLAAHEFVFGAMISQRPRVHTPQAQELLAELEIVDLTYPDTIRAAEVRQDLRRLGRSIGAWDLLIAGQAIHRGWTAVSHNLREFDRIEALEVIDWTIPSD